MEMKQTNDIRSTIKPVARTTQTIDNDDGSASVYAVIAEENIGKFFGLTRRNDMEPAASRRTGDTLVARFDGEPTEGLGDLFG